MTVGDLVRHVKCLQGAKPRLAIVIDLTDETTSNNPCVQCCWSTGETSWEYATTLEKVNESR